MKLYGEDEKRVKKFITKEAIENTLLIVTGNFIAISAILMVLSFCNFITMNVSMFIENIAIMMLAVGFVLFGFYLLIHYVIKN